jgi:hypothetical protein
MSVTNDNEGQALNYDVVYEQWDEYPDCRIHIDLGTGGEGMWGKKLPDGTFGISNMPLHTEYQWQDIVRTAELRDANQLIHRRWNSKVYFKYTPDPEEEANMELRKSIYDTLKSAGFNPGFWVDGVGYALIKENLDENAGREAVTKALETISIVPEFDNDEEE